MDAPSIEVFKPKLDRALNNLSERDVLGRGFGTK